MRVRYTFGASADVTEILDYLHARSPQGARRVRDRLKAVGRLLAKFPRSGSPTRYPWLRRITTSPYPYLIFYQINEHEILIHAVRHSAMNPSAMPDNE